MKALIGIAACLTAAAMFCSTALAGQPPVPEGVLRMELTKNPVTFDHAYHKNAQCIDCHHAVEGTANYQKCATAGCHDIVGNKDKTIHSYYRIAHDKKAKFATCVGCHAKAAGSDKELKKQLTGCKKSKCHE